MFFPSRFFHCTQDFGFFEYGNIDEENRVKGIGSEQTIESKILIHTTGSDKDMRISKVEDKWDGEIKDGPIRNALRELNSKTVPMAVSVPASVEEEERGGK